MEIFNAWIAGYGGRHTKAAKVSKIPHWLFHIDIAELRTNEGKLELFVAIPCQGQCS
jgi:hypothetical protein